jgi:hypothetical protein
MPSLSWGILTPNPDDDDTPRGGVGRGVPGCLRPSIVAEDVFVNVTQEMSNRKEPQD